nr:hypothetical protein [Streptomyces sp. BE133]
MSDVVTTNYRRPSDLAGQRVVVVDGGDSGAQIASDLAIHDGIDLTWVTRRPPHILADDIDGHALFDAATARRRALDEGRTGTDDVARSETSSPSHRSAQRATRDC